MKSSLGSLFLLVSFLFAAVAPVAAPACTGITLHPQDGSIIFGRTLEFGMDLKSNIVVIPRMVDLKAVDFNAPQIKTISMQGGEQIQDVSAQAN